MVRLSSAMVAALSAAVAMGQSSGSITCSPSSKCPTDKPCCSQYGECGTGAYCLGGCDPMSSNALGSCAPAPVCASKNFATWDNLDSIAPNTKYLGNATTADWVSSGQPLTSNGNLLLTMAPNTVGTLIAYNHYMWYGKFSAKLKTSRGAGVVTAFIMLSDVKDEIDWEFVGTELTTAQTNFYWQGVLNYENSVNASTTDTFANFHTYEVDWQPDTTTWSIDGKVVRTLQKASTYNATTRNYEYPQTPGRVQLSLWPAGLKTNAPGTIQWAGGEIDWSKNAPDIANPGYYYATFGEVDIQCYNPPAGANVKGGNSYIYTDTAGLNSSIELSNDNTVLGSFQATGTNMTAGASKSSSKSSTQTDTTSAAGPTVSDSVPGLSGGGAGSQAGAQANNGNNSASGASTQTSSASGPSVTGFSQGGSSSNGTKTNMAASTGESMLQGSMFAVLIALVALVAM